MSKALKTILKKKNLNKKRRKMNKNRRKPSHFNGVLDYDECLNILYGKDKKIKFANKKPTKSNLYFRKYSFSSTD